MDPSLFDAYYLAARFHFARGESEEAVRLFELAHEVRPEDYEALVLGGNALRQLGRAEESERKQLQALEAIQSHLELYPDDARAYYLGAVIWRLKENLEKAHEWAERALEAEPDDAAVHYNLACFYSEMGHPDKALEHLARSIDLGFMHRDWAEHDSDFENLREDPRFEEQLDRMGSSA